jgi:hypothetical protein
MTKGSGHAASESVSLGKGDSKAQALSETGNVSKLNPLFKALFIDPE